MSIWFPHIPARQLVAILRITLIGILFAGTYGALHDQVSYAISPEYFTQMKFRQFAYADFGWPPRVFAAEIGFLATWWVGLIGGWLIARSGLAELNEKSSLNYTARAFALAGGVAATIGSVGIVLGAWEASHNANAWSEWQRTLELNDLPAFIVVAYLHGASYLGGLLGVIAATIYVKRTLRRLSSFPNSP